MVDFAKLKTQKKKSTPIEPVEIFRRLPKPAGINDLYVSQAEVLDTWFQRRTQRDIVVKLHTGGGKTLVGLLMAQSTINESSEPVLYLSRTIAPAARCRSSAPTDNSCSTRRDKNLTPMTSTE